jgi:hypothetical protein
VIKVDRSRGAFGLIGGLSSFLADFLIVSETSILWYILFPPALDKLVLEPIVDLMIAELS